jgi:signal transduction histidine kinase
LRQLSKKSVKRTAAWSGYLVLLGGLVVAANIAAWPYDTSHPDSVATVIYLGIGAAVLNLVYVGIDRGRLTLALLLNGAATLLANPLDATLIGITSQILPRYGTWRTATNVVLNALITCTGAVCATYFRDGGLLSLSSRLFVLTVVVAADWLLPALALQLRSGESIISIVKHNFTAAFYVVFAYQCLAALLISYVLDGSLLGYFLATIVCVLALALTDTIAGRAVRRVLESELSDADRHLFHSRAVEGVVHNLRNHVATAVAYLKEIDPRRLDPVDRESIETATAAANDAVAVLRSLSQGATPRVSYATEPVDLNDLVTRALGMARPRARAKEVQMAVRETPDDVRVRADPLLLREVITNLVNNAIDAVAPHGHVELRTGRRSNGSPYFSVADDGPGVPDENRRHLFEPHFTTKEGGTGLGLFMSFGIVREHQGQLLFEGNRRGAVFTVMLPPFNG